MNVLRFHLTTASFKFINILNDYVQKSTAIAIDIIYRYLILCSIILNAEAKRM